MRQWKLFLSRFLLGLWIVLFSSYLFLIVFENRFSNVDSPIAEVSLEATSSVNEVAIPGRMFTCKKVDSQDQCQTEIQGRPLVLALLPDEFDRFGYRSCTATYGEQPVGCHDNAHNLGAMIDRTFQIRDIGLDTQQLKAVRRKYWGLNTLLDLGEVRLVEIGTGFAISVSIVVAYSVWVHTEPRRAPKGYYLVGLMVIGLSVGFSSYFSFWLLLLSTGFAD